MNNNTYFEHGYALLIGIRYGHWNIQNQLNGTLPDVQSLHNHFTDQKKAAYNPKNVITLTEEQATAKNILKALDDLAEKANQDAKATVIVFYAGHGETDDKRYFLVPYDFDLHLWGSKQIAPDKVVLSSQFADKINAINVDKKLVILDCCHSENMPVTRGLAARFLDGFSNDLDKTFEKATTRYLSTEKLTQGSGTVILTSCEADEKALDIGTNGLFTQVLIECLNGTKNIEQDGWVRLIDLMRYVRSEVAERAKNRNHDQHPVFKRIENIGHEDFIICAYDIAQARGLKSTPVTQAKPVIMPDNDYKYIRDFIAKGKVEKAIAETRTVAYQIKNNDVIAEVDSLSQRYNTNERKQRLGILNSDKYNEERNKITFALLELVQQMVQPQQNVVNVTGDDKIVMQDVRDANVTVNNNPINPDKDKILALINSNLDEAFDMLDEVFGTSSGIYNDFNKEYFSRSDNFNKETFRSKLKRFVKRKL